MKKYIYIIITVLFIGLLFNTKHNKDKLYISNQNLIAATDTLNIVRCENEELLFEKSTFIAKEKELNDLIGISRNEIKELEKKLNSSISYIAKLKNEIRIDTLIIHDTKVEMRDSIVYVGFDYKDRWFSFRGDMDLNLNTSKTNFNISDIHIPVPLTIGITEDNKLFVKTPNPYMNITEIDGSSIIENLKHNKIKPKWSHGIHLGIGLQYGLTHGKIDMGPSLTYGVTYNF